MTNSFLYQIAKAYAAQSDVPLRECLFVFPSRRSSLFFQKYLGQCSARPLLAPGITTIGDLFARLSPLRRGDKIELLYILWQKYTEASKRHGRPSESFDEFVTLGETLSGDFNDIDKYLADASRLLANIRDLRELDSGYEYLSPEQKDALQRFWKVTAEREGGQMSEQKRQFLSLWAILFEVYESFRDALRERGLAYEGMLQRDVAETIKSGGADYAAGPLQGVRRIVIVGQNALCECEKELFDHIKREFDGDFYWDFCGECLTDPANKASHFIPNYLDRYPSKYTLENAEAVARPQIEVISASSGVAEARVAGKVLEEMMPCRGCPASEKADNIGCGGCKCRIEDSIAVVLPDENLLMPLLGAVPQSIGRINVTMGYGLHNSAAASLMDMLASLQLGCRSGRFYHKDVLSLLSHPFLVEACGGVAAKIKRDLVADNMIYVPAEWFKQADGGAAAGESAARRLLSTIFSCKSSTGEVCLWQMEVLEALSPSMGKIEKEFAMGYYTAVSRLRDLHIPMELRTYFRFLREISSRIKLDFKGEPLSGLQIMGPLEVRSIDFETLVILSVNEGVFPAKSQNDSIIPYNVRKGFGLPTPELFDSIAAYHFYRSICRAKRVVLIYDSRTKGMLSGEESRFIKQLRYHYGFPITDRCVDLEVKPSDRTPHAIEKTPEVMARLESIFLAPEGKSFSASSLNDYLACPLKFYYKYVAGLQEDNEISEGVDQGQFGDTFHSTMEAIYGRVGKGKTVSADLLRYLKNERDFIRGAINSALNKALKRSEDAPLSRRNQITANMVEALVDVTLDNDIRYAPFEYVASEEPFFEKGFDFDGGGRQLQASLTGRLDRQDRKNGVLRVADYKTGSDSCNVSFLNPDCLDKVFSGEEKIAFQLMMYALAMHRKYPEKEGFDLAIYGVKRLFGRQVENKYCPAVVIDAFRDRLRTLLADIFNPAIPFSETLKSGKTCEYCPAKAICGK